MKIGITYNLKQNPAENLPPDAFGEFDTEETLSALAAALETGGHETVKLGWGVEALRRILTEQSNGEKRGIDFIFNLAEGLEGRNREAQMPALFELAGIPYTGSDGFTLSLALDKAQAKIVVKHAGVNTPEFVTAHDDIPPKDLPPFPLFIKPLYEGSSKGIRLNSCVTTRKGFEEQFLWIRNQYGPIPILIERFIPGREVTVGVLGNREPYVLGIMEIRYREKTGQDFIYSYEVKKDWRRLCEYIVPAGMEPLTEKRVRESALIAYRALGCRDVTRMDFRIDKNGQVYFLEANPLPGLSPIYSDLVIMARGVGWTYEKLILTILKHAQERYAKKPSCL